MRKYGRVEYAMFTEVVVRCVEEFSRYTFDFAAFVLLHIIVTCAFYCGGLGTWVHCLFIANLPIIARHIFSADGATISVYASVCMFTMFDLLVIWSDSSKSIEFGSVIQCEQIRLFRLNYVLLILTSFSDRFSYRLHR